MFLRCHEMNDLISEIRPSLRKKIAKIGITSKQKRLARPVRFPAEHARYWTDAAGEKS
jgi:hypothetical protein